MSKQKSVKTKDKSAGLPISSKPATPFEQGYVVIGKLRRPHGVRGDILFEVMTDFPERISKGKIVLVGEKFEEMKVANSRQHHVGLILHLEGYSTPEEVGVLRNLMVYMPIGDLPDLPEGEHYQHELIGLQVVTQEGELLGKLSEIMETGANDVLIIHDEAGNEVLLPDIESVVLGIDPKKGQIIVQPPEWL